MHCNYVNFQHINSIFIESRIFFFFFFCQKEAEYFIRNKKREVQEHPTEQNINIIPNPPKSFKGASSPTDSSELVAHLARSLPS